MPCMPLHHGHSAAEAGIPIALFAVSNVVMALPWGRLVDRHGLHLPWRLAVAMAFDGALLAAAWQQAWTFAVAALLVGGAMGLAQVTVQRRAGMAADSAQERRKLGLAVASRASRQLWWDRRWSGWCSTMPGSRGDQQAFAWAAVAVGLLTLSSLLWVHLGSRRRPARWSRRSSRPVASATCWPTGACGDCWWWPGPASCWDVHAFVVPVLGHERGFSASMIGFILGAFAGRGR